MVKDINAKSANLHIADPGQTQSPIQVELKIGKKKQVLTADSAKQAFMQELPSNTL